MCERSVSSLPLSRPVSQSCSPSSSVSVSLHFCLSHLGLSALISLIPVSSYCPPTSLPQWLRAGFLGPHLLGLSHVTQSPLSAPSAQLSFWLRGQMVESQAPTFPVLEAWPAGLAQPLALAWGGRRGAGLLPSEGDQPGEKHWRLCSCRAGSLGTLYQPHHKPGSFSGQGNTLLSFFHFLCHISSSNSAWPQGRETRFMSSTVTM